MGENGSDRDRLIKRACDASDEDVRSGRYQKAISTLQAARKQFPDSVLLLIKLGDAHFELGEYEVAVNFYWTAHRLNPILVPLLIKLCETLIQLSDYNRAWSILRFAIVQDPGQVGFLFTFASLLFQMERYGRSIIFFRRLLCHKPDHIAGLTNLSEVLTEVGMEERSNEVLATICELDPTNYQARLNLAFSNIALRRFELGLKQYETRLDEANPRAPRRDFDIPRWAGEDLENKRLLICSEQGVGEEVRYSAYIPQLIEASQEVYLECDKRLQPLFQRSFPKAKVFATTRVVTGLRPVHSYRWLEGQEKPDCYIDIASIPYIVGDKYVTTLPKAAIFQPDPAQTLEFQNRLRDIDPRPWVGLHWKSGIWTPARAKYFPPLENWAKLIDGLPYNFFDVNYVPAVEDARWFKDRTGETIHNFEDLDQKLELDRTTALMKNLDAVVSAATSVAVIAGGTGVPVLQLDTRRLSNPQVDGRDALIPFVERIERPFRAAWEETMSRAKARLTEIIEGPDRDIGGANGTDA